MCCSVFYLRKWYQNIKWFSIDCLRLVLLYFALWLVKNLVFYCSVFYLRKWYQNIKCFSIDCLRLFCSTSLFDWLKIARHFLDQSEVEAKPILTSFSHVFPRSAPVTCFGFQFWLVLGVVIGQSIVKNYFGLGFTTVDWKPFYLYSSLFREKNWDVKTSQKVLNT